SKETVNYLAAGIAVLVTLYFWWRNTRGIHESSGDALQIMKITTVMVVLMILWCGLTLFERGPRQHPPSPAPHNLEFSQDALGWLPKLWPDTFRELPAKAPDAAGSAEAAKPRLGLVAQAGSLLGLIGLLIAFGHSVLAMSGEESLAQVNRELEHPK